MWDFPLLPEAASSTAAEVDALFWILIGVASVFGGIITAGLVYFNIRYRKNSKASRAGAVSEHLPLELLWSIVPLVISAGIFGWGAKLYFDIHVPPENAREVYVVGKQWMWKIQHPQGNREINELHVPVGVPIKLVMTSQDVIHSFFVPAFRIKQDVLPGRYTTTWFEATKPGEYHLFCAEYCGTSHASMKGRVVVMKQEEFERWLAGSRQEESMTASGDQLFRQFGCVTCHSQTSQERGPSLHGLFGSTVRLADGSTVTADERYIRESILNPGAALVAGYKPLMPTYAGQMSQEQLFQIIEYVKSLGGPQIAGERRNP